MASMFQMQLVRYGNDHNILHIHDNILPIYSKTWVSKSVIFPLLSGRIITGNNNNDLSHVNNILQPSTSIRHAHACTPVASHRAMETPHGDKFWLGLQPASRSPVEALLFLHVVGVSRGPQGQTNCLRRRIRKENIWAG